jgi:glycosyltransferase involved in cell wall biosynthesis
MQSDSISVMISCYNEQRSIVPTIESISSALARSGLSWEIIVVDDASTDQSAETVRRFMREHPALAVRLEAHAANRGLVPGIFETVKVAHGQYFWVVAGDENVDQETAMKLLSRVGTADIVIPRVLNYAGRSYHRRIISWTYAFLVRSLSGCPVTYYNGSSIHRRSDLVWLAEKVGSFAYAADCITRLYDHGCSFVEVPVRYKERVDGNSSALTMKNLKDVAGFLLGLGFRRAKRLVQPEKLAPEKGELG